MLHFCLCVLGPRAGCLEGAEGTCVPKVAQLPSAHAGSVTGPTPHPPHPRGPRWGLMGATFPQNRLDPTLSDFDDQNLRQFGRSCN